MRLSIRPEQKSVIEAVTQENFARRIALHLRQEYPESVVILPSLATLPSNNKSTVAELPEKTLYELVHTGIECARRHEMTFESSISIFTVLMFAVSPNFYRHTLFQAILNDESVEPDHRLDEVGNIFTDQNWDSIREKYDPNAWNLEEKPGDLNESQGKDQEQTNPFENLNEEVNYQDFEKTIKINR